MAYPRRQWAGGGNLFNQTPVTIVIIGIWVVGFLAALANVPLAESFAFRPVMPFFLTGLITYPLAIGSGVGIIGLLLNGLVFYWFGGSLERGWGSRTFLAFLLASNIAAAVLWEIGILLFFHGFAGLATPWLMLSSVIVAWAWLNPDATILLWFVLPLKAKWVGWLDIVLLYLLFPPADAGVFRFLLGFFALGGVAVALWYAKWRREYGWIPRRRERAPKKPRAIRHPAAGTWRRLLRPFEDWQRRRRIARLRRTFKIDEEERRSD